MYKIGEEEMVICPYSRHHVVSKLRIQKHIIKCQKINPGVKLATCFYNYSHRLKPEDLLAHYEICSHKTRIDSARYEETISRTSSAAENNDLPQKDFPEINLKTKFFCNPSSFLPSLNQKLDEDSQKFDTPSSESENEDFYSKTNEKIVFKTRFFTKNKNVDGEVNMSDDNDEDDNDNDDLEPLPLPKTVSKAFVFSKQQASDSSTLMSSYCKPFGRGRSLLAFSPPKESRTTDHLLPDLSDMESIMPKQEKRSKFFCKNLPSSYSKSVVSSMFDDTITLKSEQIIFEDDCYDDNRGFILKNFDKYTKI